MPDGHHITTSSGCQRPNSSRVWRLMPWAAATSPWRWWTTPQQYVGPPTAIQSRPRRSKIAVIVRTMCEGGEGLPGLGGQRVGRADRGGGRAGRVAAEALLDLARADPVAAARDQVVLAPAEPEVAVGVAAREVARARPGAADLLARAPAPPPPHPAP